MVESKYIQVNNNALIEIIHDDQNMKSFDYSIIHDQKNNIKSFVINESTDLNNLDYQLFSIDKTLNKYGIVDFNKYNFLTKTDYVNNQNSEYTTIKIWFPINYIFNDTNGFYLNIFTYDYDNIVKYDLSNFYLDKSNTTLYNSIVLETQPFRMNNKVWGKSITLSIPSVSYESALRPNFQAQVGSINYNLTGSNGLSKTAPIYFDFRFLYNKKNILNEITYYTTNQLIFSTPQSIINTNLSVVIEHAKDGDYFIINGKYNDSVGELEKYMDMKALSGNQSYILYSITVYEDNIPQSTRDIYVYDNYSVGISDYRPVLKYTNTLASIKVEMKIISNVDNSMDVKMTEYILTGNEVAKYGKYLSTINITGSIKPKLYNSAPTKVNLPTQDIINSFFKRKASKKLELRYVPYPVLFNVFNIAIQNVTDNSDIKPNGELLIELKPFDNVFKFNIINYIDNTNREGYSIPVENTIVNMVFKNDFYSVRIPLYIESNEVDLKNGIVVFKISSDDLSNIKKIYYNTNSFYITLITNSIETVLYNGKFKLEEYNTPSSNTPTSNTLTAVKPLTALKPLTIKGTNDVFKANTIKIIEDNKLTQTSSYNTKNMKIVPIKNKFNL